jgi:hypothetical protein
MLEATFSTGHEDVLRPEALTTPAEALPRQHHDSGNDEVELDR